MSAPQNCPRCYRGWINVLGVSVSRTAEGMRIVPGAGVSFPCSCEAGRELLSTVPAYAKINADAVAALDRLRDMAIKHSGYTAGV